MNANDNKGKGPMRAKKGRATGVRGGSDGRSVHQESFSGWGGYFGWAPKDRTSLPALSSKGKETL